ncbi:unnamed protein product [Acanthoscelides obtectus]|uniref:Uncharacterized protein n=1 Tax=Acanthoscelides obtectus TaxID=200917 RepID=A0A9P0PMX7_ACAOB|nr:unnamed protein product [Acanthoscelides obtectus]CAK1675969.1 hypothetical protein AOBTE_LOCUS30517 [Acanthoscelides obtectus]
MKCCKKKNNTDKTYRYKEQDLPEIFRTCRPPPPPPGEELWELQFCRWWGWNWVKKKDELGVAAAMRAGPRVSIEEEPQPGMRQSEEHGGNMRKRCSPTMCNNERQMMITNRSPYERKVQKKHIKQLCNCLCFKKKPQGTPSIQNMYSTPSNSVILHETYTCGVIHNQDSVARLEAERNISRKGRRESCRCRSAVAHPWFNKVKEESESSHEGYVGGCQCCCAKANKSSTEESIEILNVRIKHIISATDCPCHKH